MRVRIIKNTTKYRKGQTLYVDNKTGLVLLNTGIAINSKDMVETDGNTK